MAGKYGKRNKYTFQLTLEYLIFKSIGLGWIISLSKIHSLIEKYYFSIRVEMCTSKARMWKTRALRFWTLFCIDRSRLGVDRWSSSLRCLGCGEAALGLSISSFAVSPIFFSLKSFQAEHLWLKSCLLQKDYIFQQSSLTTHGFGPSPVIATNIFCQQEGNCTLGVYIWVIRTRTGKKLDKCHFFF